MPLGATVQLGVAMFRLLRRPATLGWLPLAIFASMAAMVPLYLLLSWFDILPRRSPPTVLLLTLAGLLGVLVGQSIRELQHCRFSWTLPRARQRLLPGAMAIGLLVAVFAREIFAMISWLILVVPMSLFAEPQSLGSLWAALPGPSSALIALTFLAFWIGVRPSAVNLIGVLAPLWLLSPWITELTPTNSMLVALMTAPLTLFLVYDTFSVAAARRRPFVRTHSLTGKPWGRSRAEDRAVPGGGSASRRRRHAARIWPARPLGASVGRWVLAGWHENHGATGPVARWLFLALPCGAALVLLGMIVQTMFEAPALWFGSGYGRLSMLPGSVHVSIVAIVVGSMVVGVPLAVLCSAYRTISLRRTGLYPLSRRKQAAIEYWSSLAETLLVAGFATAVFMVTWVGLILFAYGTRGFQTWPPQAGSDYGWVLALMRTIGFLVIATPLAQYYRLRHIRSPAARSPVAQLLTVLMLAVLLTGLGIAVALGTLDALPSYPLVLHAAIFATAAAVAQYFYRHALERYFARADLV